MAGESLSSRFLEAVLWHTDPHTVPVQIFDVCMKGKVIEYAEDDVANFVLQTWLQRTESPKQLNIVLEELGPFLGQVREKRRAGVLWRLAGACLRVGKGEKKLVKALLLALGGEEEGGEGGKGVLAALRAVQTLLALKVGQEGGGGGGEEGRRGAGGGRDDGRLHLNVPGARLLECVMRFPAREGEEVGSGWVFCQAVLDLPRESLVAIAKDNVGSRTLLDPLLDLSSAAAAAAAEAAAVAEDAKKSQKSGKIDSSSSSSSSSSTSQWADRLAEKLQGHYASLALHPVGYHVLTKCFTTGGLSLEGKRAVAQEMMQAESRLAGGHFGRRALGVVGVSLFRGNREKWEEVQREGEKKKQVLDDLFQMLEREVVVAGKGKGKVKVEEEEEEEEEEKGGKKARKPKKEKKEKKRDGGDDSLLDLLLGKKKGKEKGEKKKEGGKEGEGEGGADLGFVLEAIKRSGGGNKGQEGFTTDSGDKRKRKSSGSRSKEQERAVPRRREEEPTTAAAAAAATAKPHKKHRHDTDAKHAGGTAVEKAQRLLGTRAMMSKSELFSAVEGLEREVKGGSNGAGSSSDAPEAPKIKKKSSSKA